MEVATPSERQDAINATRGGGAEGGGENGGLGALGEGEGRPAGPRWAEARIETVRSHRADVLAIWCRRVGGLILWAFVGMIFFRLWHVAWQEMDVKLLMLCLLITVSIIYIFLKRYRHVREIGLTGVDVVRAMTVDEGEEIVGMRGVTRKARAVCVDFKFDPQAAFQEREMGYGFEPYPPMPLPGSSAADEVKSSTREGARRRISWLWDWRRHGRHDQALPILTSSRNEGADENEYRHHPADSETDKKMEEEDDRSDHASLAARRDSADRGGEERGLSAAAAAAAEAGAHVPVDGTIGGDTLGSGPIGGRTVGSGGIGDEEEGRVVAGGAMGGEGALARPQQGQVVRACELNPSCSICLFEYFLDEDVTLLPCGHLYHTECIDIWMADHVDCPYCRADLNVWGTTSASRAVRGGRERNCPHRASAAAAEAAASAAATASAAAGRQNGLLRPGAVSEEVRGGLGGSQAPRWSRHPPWADGIA